MRRGVRPAPEYRLRKARWAAQAGSRGRSPCGPRPVGWAFPPEPGSRSFPAPAPHLKAGSHLRAGTASGAGHRRRPLPQSGRCAGGLHRRPAFAGSGCRARLRQRRIVCGSRRGRHRQSAPQSPMRASRPRPAPVPPLPPDASRAPWPATARRAPFHRAWHRLPECRARSGSGQGCCPLPKAPSPSPGRRSLPPAWPEFAGAQRWTGYRAAARRRRRGAVPTARAPGQGGDGADPQGSSSRWRCVQDPLRRSRSADRAATW